MAVSRNSVSEQTSPAPSGLTVLTVTPESLEGEYHGTYGGIRFQSTVNATHFVLSIATTSGAQVVVIIHPLLSNMTMMGVNDTNFMVMENRPGRPKYDDYVIPKDSMDLMESIMMGQGEMSDEVLQHLDNKTVNETRQSVLNSLAMSQEGLLIIEAALALGNGLGVQGSEYPAVMRFYLLALRLANARDIIAEESSFTLDSKSLRNPRQTECKNGAKCASDKCPFHKYSNDCFGMCGKGCSCWDFVCGDCCVHQYCLTHDQCCADEGFFSFACLSVAWRVLGSQCSQTYGC